MTKLLTTEDLLCGSVIVPEYQVNLIFKPRTRKERFYDALRKLKNFLMDYLLVLGQVAGMAIIFGSVFRMVIGI